jgi:hypothetical protein
MEGERGVEMGRGAKASMWVVTSVRGPKYGTLDLVAGQPAAAALQCQPQSNSIARCSSSVSSSRALACRTDLALGSCLQVRMWRRRS